MGVGHECRTVKDLQGGGRGRFQGMSRCLPGESGEHRSPMVRIVSNPAETWMMLLCNNFVKLCNCIFCPTRQLTLRECWTVIWLAWKGECMFDRLNIQVFWDVTPCRPVDSYRRFEGTLCLHPQCPAVGNCLPVNTTWALSTHLCEPKIFYGLIPNGLTCNRVIHISTASSLPHKAAIRY
jgi:hypothetical protein